MFTKLLKNRLTRRKLLAATAVAAGSAATASLLPKAAFAAGKVIKIGFLAPLTGPVSAWGKPGLDGCEIWGEWINAAGGIKLADGNHMVEFVGYAAPAPPS